MTNLQETNTKLRKKAISLKGKQYVLVSDRILAFNDMYPNGYIQTKIASYKDGKVIVKAKVTPDVTNPTRAFTGYSQADEAVGMVNKTSALENAETSAVGRALAMMGIGVLDSIASADEMRKAGVNNLVKSWKDNHEPSDASSDTMTDPPANSLFCKEHGCDVPERMSKSGNSYWGCTAGGKMHFLNHPGQAEKTQDYADDQKLAY